MSKSPSRRTVHTPTRRLLWVPILAALGCAGLRPAAEPAPVPEVRPGILQGYLAPESLPDSLALLPPPPTEGSPALALDRAVSAASLALRDTPRWALAVEDAELMFPAAAAPFACALGASIDGTETPRLQTLMRRTLADAGFATYGAKNRYQRPRPFVVNGAPTCTPELDGYLREDGSYPSGHTAIGWAWALILAELAPDRADALLARGRAFGQSRVVCNVHWQSDVIEGRSVGAATVARLHADPLFRADLEAARDELARLRARDPELTRDCAAEAAALAETAPGAPWPAGR
jgi:acid phosphatase (class A)